MLNPLALRHPDGWVIFFFNDTATTEIYTLSLHDALPIFKNAPDPVFVSDLEGKILQANDAVSELLGFRPAELGRAYVSTSVTPMSPMPSSALIHNAVGEAVADQSLLQRLKYSDYGITYNS